MNCNEFKQSAHDYYMGRLEPAEDAAFVGHATSCPTCGQLRALCEELTCRDFVDFLNEYIDGQLDPERRAVFDRHLAICSDCTKYLDSYTKTMRLSVAAFAPKQPIAEAPPAELVRAILEARKRR